MKVTVYKEEDGLCFMDCPICKSAMFVTTDKWHKCINQYTKKHKNKPKYVFRLLADKRCSNGFCKAVYAKVLNFNRTTLKELEV